MAKDKREMTAAEAVLHKWAMESQNGQASLPDFDPDFSASFPNLWVFLTWRHVGKLSKQPGSVTIRADGTGWRLTYLDPTAKRRCSVLASSLMEGLRALDSALVAGDTLWDSFGNRNRGWRKDKD